MNELLGNQANQLVRPGSLEMVNPASMVVPRALGGKQRWVADQGEAMESRVLGGTGISVSGFALGTMMLGAMGNPDHDESIRMIHTALDAGINFVDTADVYSRG
jgi:aryl-alcohol dehydrogenase-like predicted oxidoreductase